MNSCHLKETGALKMVVSLFLLVTCFVMYVSDQQEILPKHTKIISYNMSTFPRTKDFPSKLQKFDEKQEFISRIQNVSHFYHLVKLNYNTLPFWVSQCFTQLPAIFTTPAAGKIMKLLTNITKDTCKQQHAQGTSPQYMWAP